MNQQTVIKPLPRASEHGVVGGGERGEVQETGPALRGSQPWGGDGHGKQVVGLGECVGVSQSSGKW